MSKTMVECPIASCGGTTDTGGECPDCGFDWKNDARSEKQKFTDEWLRLTGNNNVSKEELADFCRHNEYGLPVDYCPYDRTNINENIATA